MHNVLPHGVLSLEKISAISEDIRLKEEPEPLRDLGDPSIAEFERPIGAAEGLRLGLNQANDLGWDYKISRDYILAISSETRNRDNIGLDPSFLTSK